MHEIGKKKKKNPQNKRHRVAGRILKTKQKRKIRAMYILPMRTSPFRYKDTHRLKVKVWKKILYVYGK